MVAALVAGVDIIANHFYLSTGSTLDASLFMFSLQNFSETWNVISSEVPIWTLGGLFIALGFFALGPVLLGPRFSPNAPLASDTSPGALAAPAMFASAAFLIALACTPPLAEPYAPFARASVVNLGLSALDLGSDEDVAIIERPDLTQASLTLANSAKGDAPRHLAFIILESTRARSTSVYNPELNTTPFLAELAEKSLVAERAYAVVPHTSKALVAMLCGIEPQLNMPITEAFPGAIPAPCLADLLRDQGYATAFFQSATEHFEGRRQLIDNMGYDYFLPVDEMSTRGFGKANYFGYEDDVMLAPSESWLRRNLDSPTFTTYLTLTPHHHYVIPDRYGKHKFDADKELNKYHNAVRYVDHFVDNIIKQYKELGLYDDTLFVVVGDHGEGFGEHGRRQHDNVIYEEGVRVPMMLYAPHNLELAGRIEEPISHIDLLPTLVNLLGFDLSKRFPGFDIREIPENRAVFAQCWYERRCMASIRGDDKYIHHFGTQPDERFNLNDDPLEERSVINLHDDNHVRVRELVTWRASVNAWHEHENAILLDKVVYDELPPIANQVNVKLGDFARIRGFDVSTDVMRPGENVTFTYVFEALSEIPEGWGLFVHAEGPGRTKFLDHVTASGLYPLQVWKPGDLVVDQHSFVVPGHWKDGEFNLRIGIYHRKKGRVEVSGDVPITDDKRATLITLPVER
ncbi:LTA synthase family protein [Lujinxingia vulgaris]|uniref:LTA synthase family protein n=1 Tax=Lujinxingia vulgaris TaxID=2600176 RepID=UPI001E2F6308|nr:LTA synthase family protein [Lujinxingia vulgaris]